MRIISWNVQGLRSPRKRIKILRHLHCLNTDIALLQEAHLKETDFHRMHTFWVGEVIGSPSHGRKAGVLILLNRHLNYSLKDTKIDSDGRIILTRFVTNSLDMRITNIYTPNFPTKQYFQGLLAWLADIPHQTYIIGGDFNTVMNIEEDR